MVELPDLHTKPTCTIVRRNVTTKTGIDESAAPWYAAYQYTPVPSTKATSALHLAGSTTCRQHAYSLSTHGATRIPPPSFSPAETRYSCGPTLYTARIQRPEQHCVSIIMSYIAMLNVVQYCPLRVLTTCIRLRKAIFLACLSTPPGCLLSPRQSSKALSQA